VFAADQTGYDHVRFTSLLQTDTTVDAWVNKAFTVSTNHLSIFCGHPHPSPHGDSSRNLGVALRQFWFFADVLFCQFEKCVYPLQGYVPSFIHLGFFSMCVSVGDMEDSLQYPFFGFCLMQKLLLFR